MNILVLHTQVPFVHGGAEVLVAGLMVALRERGHQVDLVSLPLQWNPPEHLLTTALAWRMLDVTSFNGVEVDMVICTKFPTWAVDHPHKRLWLIHQHRQAYDLHGSALSEFTPDADSQAIREQVMAIDRAQISSCTTRFAISRNVADRLRRYNGVQSEALYPPIPREGLEHEGFDPFILSVSRLDAAKRVDRLIAALPSSDPDVRVVIVGDGPERLRLEQQAEQLGVSERVHFTGRATDDAVRWYYNHARAVYYAPIDEDYGYATVEAMRAGKGVLTAQDSGGTLEFVEHDVNGIVTELNPLELGSAMRRIWELPTAERLGAAGPERTTDLTWDVVVSRLLA